MENLKPVSQIEGDVLALVASYSSPIKDQVYTYKVRGRLVSKLPHMIKEERGRKFQLVIFQDTGAEQWVNVENLRGFKLSKFAGGNP